MSFKPLADNVLIKVAQAEEKSALGIYVPDSAQEKPNNGEVIAVGSGTLVKDGTRYPVEVKEGDKVVFRKNNEGIQVDIDDEDHLVLREYDIIGIM